MNILRISMYVINIILLLTDKIIIEVPELQFYQNDCNYSCIYNFGKR